MTIQRWQGSARGRNRAVSFNGMVWTVATAADTTLGVTGQTELCLAALDKNLADAGSDKTLIVSAQIFLADMST